ncbi:relaxase/mobilization nuclease domain-containing protein, partial [Bacillus gaemokensis]
MATIKLGNTKNANALLRYAEKRSEVSCGVDCDVEYVRSQMTATREMWGKNKGIQAHHVIQSFKPGEVTPGMANKIGEDLARKLAPGYEVAIYTHTDKEHVHNHIIINSVNMEDGRKYHAHGVDAIERVRKMSDELCEERGLSVVKEPSAQVRYTLAEKSLLEKGKSSWKDEIRQVIDLEKHNTSSYEEFKRILIDKYRIEVKERGANISFKHPDMQRFVRGKTLGLAYERGTIENE